MSPQSVTYGSGSFSGKSRGPADEMVRLKGYIGTEFTDTVTLGNGLTIKSQSIGVASRSQGFDGVDGILG